MNTEPVLYVAVQEGHYKCVQLLIQAGADVNTVYNEGLNITAEVRPILLFGLPLTGVELQVGNG